MYNVAIIGAGIGGLLAGASLAKQGKKVIIIEKMPYLGGRFTNLPYKGFQLSTGAVHLIPHGNRGPLAQFLQRLGLSVKIEDCKPWCTFRIRGKDYLINDVSDFNPIINLFPLIDRLRMAKILFEVKLLGLPSNEITLEEWLKNQVKDELAVKIANAFYGFALSLHINSIPAGEGILILKRVNDCKGSGVPIGGCKSIIDSLVKFIELQGGKILTKAKVVGVDIDNENITKLHVESDQISEVSANFVISDIGAKETVELVGEKYFDKNYLQKVESISPSAGVKINIASKKSFFKNGILFTPDCQRIGGLIELTTIDPSLAPQGQNLIISHQPLLSTDIKKEIEIGLEDLKSLIPSFDQDCEILLIQSYHNGWPVNRAASGLDIGSVTPLKNLFLVGDSVKEPGWIDTEGVASGVEQILEYLSKIFY
ncbi:MAG: FAD-dependent oxidoreductase [Euryarchaeota archaeon]|nr:FAD-dependent oxidoreductase [Euryarchaeota archaeon]